jgi:hypothetical protein
MFNIKHFISHHADARQQPTAKSQPPVASGLLLIITQCSRRTFVDGAHDGFGVASLGGNPWLFLRMKHRGVIFYTIARVNALGRLPHNGKLSIAVFFGDIVFVHKAKVSVFGELAMMRTPPSAPLGDRRRV